MSLDFKYLSQYLITRLLRVSFLFFVLWLAFQFRAELQESKDLKVYPEKTIKYFNFGYGEVVADAIYIKLLMNLDYCENSNANSFNPNQNKNIQNILEAELSASRCDKGWVYQWTDLLLDLSPKFKSVYAMMGTVLSVLVDDRMGAKEIFDKGLKKFPKDWVLNYRAAYHYLYEIQDAERAAELMLVSYKNGGPDFLPALAAQLYTRIGKAAFSKHFLEEFVKDNPDSLEIEKIQRRLKEADETLQK